MNKFFLNEEYQLEALTDLIGKPFTVWELLQNCFSNDWNNRKTVHEADIDGNFKMTVTYDVVIPMRLAKQALSKLSS